MVILVYFHFALRFGKCSTSFKLIIIDRTQL